MTNQAQKDTGPTASPANHRPRSPTALVLFCPLFFPFIFDSSLSPLFLLLLFFSLSLSLSVHISFHPLSSPPSLYFPPPLSSPDEILILFSSVSLVASLIGPECNTVSAWESAGVTEPSLEFIRIQPLCLLYKNLLRFFSRPDLLSSSQLIVCWVPTRYFPPPKGFDHRPLGFHSGQLSHTRISLSFSLVEKNSK